MSKDHPFNNTQESTYDGFNEYETDQSVSHQQHSADNLTSPLYAKEDPVNLDQNAPTLAAGSERRLNKSAVIFLGLLGLSGFAAATFAFKHFFAGSAEKPPAEEIVTVPEMTAPTIAPTPPAPLSTEPVPVVTETKPLPEMPVMPAPPQPMASMAPMQTMTIDKLSNRRKESNSLVNTSAPMGSANGFFEDEFNPVKQGAVQRLNNPDARLVRGTYIRCVLQTKIISDVKGFTSCVVTEPVYSTTGKKLLMPKGTRISGQYKYGDLDTPRVEVIWNRALTPAGLDIRLDSPGADQLGAIGHTGHYNSHWAARLGSALLISVVSDAFKVAAAKYAPSNTTISDGTTVENPFDSNTADTLQKAAEQALSRSANRPSTVTINQGTLLTIYTSRDIDFSSLLDD